MKIIRTIKSLNKSISNVSNLGFVPTMGGLHQGHLSLIKKSVNKCKSTLVSIYINPTQFNNQSDFTTYPRNFKNDLKLLKKTKVDFVFIPNNKPAPRTSIISLNFFSNSLSLFHKYLALLSTFSKKPFS